MTEYTTKDSGARQEFDSGMQRDTEAGKPRFDLLVPEGVPYEDQLLTRFAALLSRGAEKYEERNWEQANSMKEVNRARSSAFRHFMQWFCGEGDEDHAVATMFNIMVVETVRPRAEAAEVETETVVAWGDPQPITLEVRAAGVPKEVIALAMGVSVEELDSNTLEMEEVELDGGTVPQEFADKVGQETAEKLNGVQRAFDRGGYMPRVEDLRM